ncbi:hypothetical protein MLD38_014607 [Melastoma candidum]|uniref:Uncharacterized protein n=1 Tax=Melastoma candidum TaxID=119954 RepID=A0ACB9RDB6_9MYRT|nr:hypothetical protein MLD38_014607 [Melastoma candidum]
MATTAIFRFPLALLTLGLDNKGSEAYPKDSVVSQVTIACIQREVRASYPINFLEDEIGGQVWRCRLKTSWTPHNAYPDFNASTDMIQQIDGYVSVEHIAFVHFASTLSAASSYDASKLSALVFDRQYLKISLRMEGPLLFESEGEDYNSI